MRRSILIAAAGPSLPVTASFPWDIPAAAVSTAIQVVACPDFWFFTDPPSRNYGPDDGIKHLNDHAIRKIVPLRGKTKDLARYPNLELVPYSSSHKTDMKEKRQFMDGKLPLLRSKHLTLLFAIQWLVRDGYNRLVFAGVDLKSTIQRPRAWGKLVETQKPNLIEKMIKMHNEKHDGLLEVLKEWTQIAARNGVEFLNWSPGSRLNQIMPWYGPKPTPPPHAQDQPAQPSPA